MPSTEQPVSQNPGFRRIRHIASKLLGFATVSTILIAFLGLFGRMAWAFELMSHFRVQYCVLLGSACAVLLLGKRYKLATAAGLSACLGVMTLLPFWVPITQQHDDSESWPRRRVILLNVHSGNTDHSRVIDFISRTDADFVFLLEVNDLWDQSLEPLKETYSYFEVAPRKGAFGIAVFSRVPISRFEQMRFSGAGGPTIVAHVDGEPALTIIATHTLPPIRPSYAARRNQHLADLAEYCSRQDHEVMLLGDLNITSWSPFFDDLIASSGLRDSRLGQGIQPSWPAHRWPLEIPIDHCLVSSGIIIKDRRVGPDLNSDHLPVIVDFCMKP